MKPKKKNWCWSTKWTTLFSGFITIRTLTKQFFEGYQNRAAQIEVVLIYFLTLFFKNILFSGPILFIFLFFFQKYKFYLGGYQQITFDTLNRFCQFVKQTSHQSPHPPALNNINMDKIPTKIKWKIQRHVLFKLHFKFWRYFL